MTLDEIIKLLDLHVLTDTKEFSEITPTYGYASDLLSCVMAGAKGHGLWVTLQSHINIVAVAALLELSAVIITEGAVPDQNTIDKANEQGLILLSTDASTFAVVGKLWQAGIRDQ